MIKAFLLRTAAQCVPPARTTQDCPMNLAYAQLVCLLNVSMLAVALCLVCRSPDVQLARCAMSVSSSSLWIAQGAFVVSHDLTHRITPLPSSCLGSCLLQEAELEGGIVLGQRERQVSKAGAGQQGE